MRSKRVMTITRGAASLLLAALATAGILNGCSNCPEPKTPVPEPDRAFDPNLVGRCCALPSTKAWQKVTIGGVDMLHCGDASQCNYRG